nr:TrfB-related DNA-binding protein [Pseudomonas sp. NFPP33]AGH89226.1 KorA: transcriptional repressor [uncultured bacterium]
MTAKKSPEQLLRKGSAKKRSMTASEFAAVEPLLNISPERIKAARLALVDGMTYEGAATVIGLGWSRQAVGDCARVVWREFEAFQKASAAAHRNKTIPEGWEQITLVAPRELIPDFYAQIAAAAPGNKKPAKRKQKQPKGEA